MHEHLDHIMWACADLEAGSRQFESLTGVRPRFGGVHASGLTHNALVRIGPRCYLEILAPTGPASADDDAWCRLARAAREPQIVTYCQRSALSLSDLAAIAQAHGFKDSLVAGNGRRTPDGVDLRWQWVAPKVDGFGLAFPFFIDWLDSPHPAEMLADTGVSLREWVVQHPQAPRLRRILAELGSPTEAQTAEHAAFRLVLETPRGTVSL
jgi:Glyoxalase-like domain